MADPANPDALLILAPEGRDAAVLLSLMAEAGLPAVVDQSGEALLRAIRDGDSAGAILTDQALTRLGLGALRQALADEPTWSDFPFILLGRRGMETKPELRSIEQAINATLLERPLHPASLVSAARSARRSRKRQRVAAGHLQELETARAELSEFADTLELKVRERTADLATANDRLTKEIADRERAEARLLQAQKMEAVGQLTGGIAHDFNNLLTAVIGSLDLLLRRSDDDRVRRLAGNALQAAERGAKLTTQLLAFSRRQRLSPVPVNVNDVISNMGDLLARSLGARIRIETRLDGNLGAALVDPTQLEMMVLNLAINARDAMPSGGRLTVATRNLPAVPERLEADLKPGEYVEISVTDTGTGMSKPVAQRAFEPFFTTKMQGKGTGLGLSQLYGFAKQSGGTAKIETSEGEGTTVLIYLPRTYEVVESGTRLRVDNTIEHRGRVLLVDDDDDVRTAAAAMLDELGYEFVSAHRATEALQKLQEEIFDVVLTDVVMPGMTGVDLAERISAMELEVPVVFATGYADIHEFSTSLDNRMVLRKPFRMAELASRLSAAMPASARAEGVIDLDESGNGAAISGR